MEPHHKLEETRPRHAGLKLQSTAAAIRSERKIGNSTGGTSQVRNSNEEDFDI
jgi:hypothetical protein